MDTLTCILSRRSIRKFLEIPVEFEKIGNILDAGKFAPSSGNVQDVRFILVTEKETIEEIAQSCVEQYWINLAPVVIVVCSDPAKSEQQYGEQGRKYSIQNGAAAVQNMLLATHNQGLATCWVGAFEEPMLRRVLRIPDNVIIHAVLPIGYADEKVPTPPRMNMEHVVFIESWGNRTKNLAAYMEWYGEHVQKAIKKGKKFVKEVARRLQQ